MSSKKIKYKYGSDCRNLSPWRMKVTLSMKWETWEVTTKKWNFNFIFVLERKFSKGDIVQHFKREKMTDEQLKEEPNLYLYEIIGTARHTENKEEIMIYKPLYPTECTNGVDFAARPLEMFISEVDHQKYPEIKQKYRFELYESENIKD